MYLAYFSRECVFLVASNKNCLLYKCKIYVYLKLLLAYPFSCWGYCHVSFTITLMMA